MKKIYSELSRIQQELKAPKNLYNNFGKYKYRNAEGILEAVKPVLNGYALIINDEPVLVGDRFYIKATVTLTDGEESVSAVAYAREDAEKRGMDGCQLTGACSSYARKYALNALLMIDDSKDSDDDSLSPKNPANQSEKEEIEREKEIAKNNPAVVNEIPKVDKAESAVARAFADSMNEFMERYGIADSQEALKKFNSMRESLQNGGAIPKNKKMQSVKEVSDTFDAIYKNFKPSGEAV